MEKYRLQVHWTKSYSTPCFCSRLIFFFNFGQILDQIFGQVFDQIFGQVFDQGFDQDLGREKNINTMYSTTGTEKYSVQYYSDGKTYYAVLFLKKV